MCCVFCFAVQFVVVLSAVLCNAVSCARSVMLLDSMACCCCTVSSL